MLFDAGVLSGKFPFRGSNGVDLISSNIGGTAEQTQALLEKARGGILFIDEAPSLDKRTAGADFGIRKRQYKCPQVMEDNRDDIMIILPAIPRKWKSS